MMHETKEPSRHASYSTSLVNIWSFAHKSRSRQSMVDMMMIARVWTVCICLLYPDRFGLMAMLEVKKGKCIHLPPLFKVMANS